MQFAGGDTAAEPPKAVLQGHSDKAFLYASAQLVNVMYVCPVSPRSSACRSTGGAGSASVFQVPIKEVPHGKVRIEIYRNAVAGTFLHDQCVRNTDLLHPGIQAYCVLRRHNGVTGTMDREHRGIVLTDIRYGAGYSVWTCPDLLDR